LKQTIKVGIFILNNKSFC